MASSSLEMMWKLMAKHDIEDVIEDHASLLCALCHRLMIDAFISNCGCQFCRSCLDKLLADGDVHCPGRRRDCRLQLWRLDVDVLPDHSSNIKISRLRVSCPNIGCDCVVEMRKLEEHLRVCKVTENVSPHSQSVEEVMEKLQSELNLLKEEAQRNELRWEKELVVFRSMLTEESARFDGKIEEFRRFAMACSVNGGTTTETQSPAKALRKEDGRQLTGEMFWRVDNFSEKSHRAKKNSILSIRSDRFISHKRGYTLCLVMYPNGCATGLRTHLYIGFNIMKGDFDEELRWPFRGSITISLVDQTSKEKTFVRTYNYDSVGKDVKYLLDRPSVWRNHGWGDIKLIKLYDLFRNVSLLKDDSLLVHCSVDPFNGATETKILLSNK